MPDFLMIYVESRRTLIVSCYQICNDSESAPVDRESELTEWPIVALFFSLARRTTGINLSSPPVLNVTQIFIGGQLASC